MRDKGQGVTMKNNNYLEQLCQRLNVELTHDEVIDELESQLIESEDLEQKLSAKDDEIDGLKAKLADLSDFIDFLISQPMSHEELIIEAKKMQRYFYL